MIFSLAMGHLALKCNPKLNLQPVGLTLLMKRKKRTLLIRDGGGKQMVFKVGEEWSFEEMWNNAFVMSLNSTFCHTPHITTWPERSGSPAWHCSEKLERSYAHSIEWNADTPQRADTAVLWTEKVTRLLGVVRVGTGFEGVWYKGGDNIWKADPPQSQCGS